MGSVSEKTERKEWLKMSEDKLVNAEHLVQELEHTKSNSKELATKVGKPDGQLKSSEEQVRFPEKKLAGKRNQLLAKNTVATGSQENVAERKEEVSLLAGVKPHKVKSAAAKKLVDGVCKTFSLPKTASKKRALSFSKQPEKLLAHWAIVETEFVKYRGVKRTMIDQLQTSLKGNNNAQVIITVNTSDFLSLKTV